MPWWPAGALLALLTFLCMLEVRPALAASSRETLIPVLFGDVPDPGGLDANGDDALTVADMILLGPDFTPTVTRTPSVTGTPTRSPTRTFSPTTTATPSITSTPTRSPTPTLSPTATETPPATATPTATLSPTPNGLIFAGNIVDLIPHGTGDQLVYRVIDYTGKVVGTETTNVLSSDPSSGAFVVDDLEDSDNPRHEVQSYTDTGSQLLFDSYSDILNNVRTSCDPPLLRLTTPLIVGQTFSTSVTCPVHLLDSGTSIGDVDRTDTFTPIERLDSYTVAAGTYSNVVHLSGTTNQEGTPENDEFYLAPGVGPILQLQSFSGYTTKYELTGGTIGGIPVGQLGQ